VLHLESLKSLVNTGLAILSGTDRNQLSEEDYLKKPPQNNGNN
jgi:hypothetical protein